ncbi:triadin-like [Drosophila sulfurigaster albostrigata]|uniref:triadin-like n=1 Tax=Drosophila sulfurigaster albostrigata TaxID=89887 RepID=UPI002D21E48E|nr:triadin-like [Drosophila sulfurigaster albostrigata]
MTNNAEQKKTEEDKQNIAQKSIKEEDLEIIAQKSIKEEDSERPQSGLKKKKKHDKCEKISKGSKPEDKALKSIKRKKAEVSLTGLIEEVVPVKKVQFQKQDQDSCEKNSEDKEINFSEEFKSISQKQVQQEEDKQNILKEIQDNLEKKSRGSSPESIAQKSIKEEDSERPQSGLKKKKKHDKCEKISKGSKPEDKALKSIKRKKAEVSLTGLIEEVVPVKQVHFQKQNQDSCEKNSEDSEKFESISQKQIEQIINNGEQKKTEEDKQNILKEIQDNLEEKSRGSKPEIIAQKSIKEKDSDRSHSGLKKKKKHDKCEKISKGSKSESKALKSIKRKTEEASLTKLIEDVVPVKQVLFEKHNQDSCEKKSEDKRDNFKENLKKAKFENIEQETIQQSINDQKKNSLTLQDIIQNQNKENKNHKMLKENQDTYVKISKGSKPGNTNLKSIEEIVPVKQVMVQKRDQDNERSSAIGIWLNRKDCSNKTSRNL